MLRDARAPGSETHALPVKDAHVSSKFGSSTDKISVQFVPTSTAHVGTHEPVSGTNSDNNEHDLPNQEALQGHCRSVAGLSLQSAR